MASVLIIDDEVVLGKNIGRFLEKSGHDVAVALDGATGLAAFDRLHPDVVIVDYRLPDIDGIALIGQLRQRDAAVPIMMITGHGNIELAVDAMKAGANDLLTKPVALAELRARVEDFLSRQRASGRLNYFEQRDHSHAQALIGESAALRELRGRIARIAAVVGDSLPPVLIIGETGVGKELVARALHYSSCRAEQPFVEINCAAIPENLLESELFGHERGAFTDARERKIGLLEAADGGTLFLDEIGEMHLSLQAKLLKVLEDGRIRRVGGVQERQVNLRILAATHQNLESRIQEGRFRADLYFRLKVLQIDVPPLRAREGDIVLLARHFLAVFAQRYHRAACTLGADAARRLAGHHWPGNVRELRNVIEQAVLLAQRPEIGAQDLMLPARTDMAGEAPPAGASRIDQIECEMIMQAMRLAGGNVSQAARDLGISRDTLRYRLEKYDIRASGSA